MPKPVECLPDDGVSTSAVAPFPAEEVGDVPPFARPSISRDASKRQSLGTRQRSDGGNSAGPFLHSVRNTVRKLLISYSAKWRFCTVNSVLR